MSEQKTQAKILKWLKDNNFYVFKTIVCNRSGIMDIICCAPGGRFVGIEVKYGSNKTSRLQDWNINQVNERGGLAFVAYSLEQVIKACRSADLV